MKLAPRLLLVLLGATVFTAPGQDSNRHRFQFRLPHNLGFRLANETPQQPALLVSGAPWLEARIDGNSTNLLELGSRVVLQLHSPDDLKKLLAGDALELSRTVRSNIFILQAPDALSAMRAAHRLAALPEVAACYPVIRRFDTQAGPYAARSNDPFAIPFFYTGGGQLIEALWPIEDRDGFSTRLGLDLNVMAAWPYTLGVGVTVAVADSGLELNHPELVGRLAGAPHFNFVTQTNTNPGPIGGATQSDPLLGHWVHGTAVGGLIAAERNNGKGMTGVAPGAKLASWLIYGTNGALVSDEQLMDMYAYASDVVGVQNHSWGAGNGLRQQDGPSLLEQVGLENAVTLGRNGRGVVMVRAAGNDREIVASANDDGYPNSPDVITVGAVTRSGRATIYSEPGACLLVAAPGGGSDSSQGLFTLDLVGTRGLTFIYIFSGDLNDYNFGAQGFMGTSASAPQVAGVAALVLSANTNLSYRDVQQILLLSARHWDLTDPDLAVNGAGLRVSHNVGFGVPDAGHAVKLARMWSNRPPLVTFTLTDNQPLSIPDHGLRLEATGSNLPPEVASITAFPTFAPAPDAPTASLPLVDIGVATDVPAVNLTNKGALILRDATPFAVKISNAAKAGAAFAIIYDSTNGGSFNLGLVAGTEYDPIPAVFIGHASGEGLKQLFATNGTALARLHQVSAEKTFHVRSPLLCEQIGVRVRTDHPVRGDLRIVLRSPQGTRSVLQHFNDDSNPGPTDWTYWTTHHFFESSAGDWTVSVTDEFGGAVGDILSVSLILRGTQITDADQDGLDDAWEGARLGTLAYGPKDDPDGDGYANAREQLMGTNPQVSDIQTTPNLSRWGLFGSQMLRLSWESAPLYEYQIAGGSNVTALSLLTNVPGAFAESDLFVPYVAGPDGFFRVRAFQKP